MNGNVFENVYLFETDDKELRGIVRADSIGDAIDRVMDKYPRLGCVVHFINASSLDDDYGVISFEDAIRIVRLNETINDKLYDAIDNILGSIQKEFGITDGGCDPFDENKLDEVRHELADVMEKIVRYQFDNTTIRKENSKYEDCICRSK